MKPTQPKLITDKGEFNILNIKIIDTEMKTIYIEEKQKGFVILISNKILDIKSDTKLLEGFDIVLDERDSYLELVGFDVKLQIETVTKLNVNSKFIFLEELHNDKYRLTFSSALIYNIYESKILIKS
jgi:hypothetical protein